MADPNTISAATAELVQAGWHRQDPDRRGLYRHRPGTDWWCCSTEPGLIDDDGDRQLLSLHHRSGWCCTVAADAGTGTVEDLTVWVELPGYTTPCCLVTAGWWPGLRALVAMAHSMLTTMPVGDSEPAADA